MWRHWLVCYDHPLNLLARLQVILMDAFWYKLHWLPQSILYLQAEDHALVTLASRGDTFRLELIKRNLPIDLVWKPIACSFLKWTGDFGLWTTHCFYWISPLGILRTSQTFIKVFLMCGLFLRRKQGTVQPLCTGCSMSQWFHRDGLHRKAHSRQMSKVINLGQVLELAGPDLDNAAAPASHMGMRLSRLIQQLLGRWWN